MTKTINGKIHGKTIELDEDLGVADGQEVQVQVTIVQPTKPAIGMGWRRHICGRLRAADDLNPDTTDPWRRSYQDRAPAVERRPQVDTEE